MFDDDDVHPLTPNPYARPRPWDGCGVAPHGTWADVVRATQEQISSVEHRQENDGNRLFMHRLKKDLGETDLKLPAFPAAVKTVDQMMKRDIADAFKFSQLLETDEALLKAVWYFANSVQFSRPANSLRGAIARLSQDQMWRVITRVGIESTVWHVPKMRHWVNQQRIHGVVTAEAAAHLAGQPRCAAYVAGLLHGIGRLSIYRAAIRFRRGPAPEPTFVEEVARQLYPQIGVLIARTWDLDPTIVTAIGFHNSPGDAPEEGKREAWLVHLGAILAHTAMAEAEGLDTEGREALGQLPGVQFDLDEAMDIAHDALSEAESFIAAEDDGDET